MAPLTRNELRPETFEATYQAYQPLVARMVRTLWASGAQRSGLDWEDLEQVGVIALWQAWRKYDAARHPSFTVWARYVIHDAIVDEIKRWMRKKRTADRQAWSFDGPAGRRDGLARTTETRLGDVIPDPTIHEDRWVAALDAKHLLAQIVAQLSPRERTVFDAWYIYQQSIAHIARHTGMSYKSVDNTLQRIHRKARSFHN